MAVSIPKALDVSRLRADFAVFDELVNGKPVAYLDSASSTQKPRQVLDRMRHFYEHEYANVHRGVYTLAERATKGFESARLTVAGFLNAPSEREVIFTRSATEALNLVAYSWGLENLRPGDIVLVTELEHHANFVPWQWVASRTGARFRHIPIDDGGELRLEVLEDIALEGDVKVVATGLVSNTLGTINPVKELAAWAHSQGAIMVVDAAQAAPHRQVDVQALDCDFCAISSHKLCGPSGVGALFGRAALLEAMTPFNFGGEMIRSVSLDRTTFNDLPHKFEAGTPAIAEAVGFGAAVDYITQVGLAAIEQHEHELTRYAVELLSEIDGVTLYGPPVSRRGRNRVVHGRGRPSTRRGPGARLGRRSGPRRPPLHPAADDAARGRGHQPRKLLPLHAPRRRRQARGRPADGEAAVRMSEFEDLYREVILDHYKSPRNYGVLDPSDAVAEGQNPLCGDELSVSVRFGEGDVIDEIGFEGRGCAISQAAMSMLGELVVGRTAAEVAAMPKDELLDEIGIPLTPARLKCAILGLGVLKVALHRAKGTPLPEEWGTSDGEIRLG